MNAIATPLPFRISNEKLKRYSEKKIKEHLRILNLSCSGEYFVRDYFRKKIIVANDFSTLLGGYSKDMLDELGERFYEKILDERNLILVNKIQRAAFKLFFNYRRSERKNIVVSYKLPIITKGGEKMVLHQIVMPYMLCSNGNLWLCLCYIVRASDDKGLRNAHFVHTETAKRYDFVEDAFIPSDKEAITLEEKQILRWIIQGLKNENMCSLLDISLSSFKAKKLKMFKKLEAKTSAQAVYHAYLYGLF